MDGGRWYHGEDAKAPQKKENNTEVHRPPVGQMTEREVLDDEE